MHATTNEIRLGVLLAPSIALLVAMLLALPAVAQGTRSGGLVSGSASCPDPAAVQAEVFRLTSPEARAEHLSMAQVSVFDAGNTYSIEIVTGTERFQKTYADPARECDKRVRFAAVYVVMTLMPPELAAAPEGSEPAETERGQARGGPSPERAPVDAQRPLERPEPAPPESAAFSTPQSEGPSRAELLELELGLTGQWSISSSEVPRISAYGGELLGALGRGPFAWLLAFGFAPSQSFEIGPARAEMLEVNARTGARARWDVEALELAADASLALAGRRIQGRTLDGSEPQTVAEIGAHLGISASLVEWRRLGPVVGFRMSYFPSPSELSAVPSGRLGTLPSFWVGALVGLRMSP